MSFDPTPDQRQAIQAIFEWYRAPQHPYLTLGGYAGTGKTSLLAAIRQIIFKLNPKAVVAFCAYTGKASRVLELTLTVHAARKPKDTVSTIHSLIYAPVIATTGHVTGWKRKEKIKSDMIIVDEASMVDRQIWEDLLSFGLPILAVGDHGQLPPIQPGFSLMAKPDIRLETIHRQAADNPIIQLSMMAREQGHVDIGNYGAGVKKLDRYDSGTGSEVENILQSNRKELLILTGYNASRIQLNKQMRQYFGFESEDPQAGDRVICLKNNWEKGIYNGMVGKVVRVSRRDPVGAGSQEKKLYDMEIDMEDGTLTYTGNALAAQFGNPTSLAEIIHKRDKVDLFDFGYALTVHKAQGSQAKQVLLFEERNKHMSDDDWRRWLYTGITRAEERLTIVGA
jgi:exodeoxyribonuclease V